jgi:hypothetical protein
VPHIRPQSLSSTSFLIHYSLLSNHLTLHGLKYQPSLDSP